MPYETLIVERRGPVGWLIFNRPEAMNSHNLQMLREVPEAWAELAADDDVRVIVNTGTRPVLLDGRRREGDRRRRRDGRAHEEAR